MGNEVRLIDMHTLWQCETCFHHYPNGCDTYCDHGESYRPAADKLTVIDPESLRPKGRWKSLGCGEFVCERCWSHVEYESRKCGHNFCPNCGAKMEG